MIEMFNYSWILNDPGVPRLQLSLYLNIRISYNLIWIQENAVIQFKLCPKWNSLTTDVVDASSVDAFKTRLSR